MSTARPLVTDDNTGASNQQQAHSPASAVGPTDASTEVKPIRWHRLYANFRNLGYVVAVISGVGGWAAAAYMHFYYNPKQERISYTKSRYDTFADAKGPFQISYVKLGEKLRPWFRDVERINSRIQATTDEGQRKELIRERDEGFLRAISRLRLSSDVELLVGYFDELNDCPSSLCDPSLTTSLFGIEIVRFWEAFKPYILKVRGEIGSGSGFGSGLEALYAKVTEK